MILKKCILHQNTMLTPKYNIPILDGKPVGIIVHSTGANNVNLWRYVQPSADDPDRETILADIGVNTNNNSHNGDVGKGLHAFIGKNAAGVVEVYQTLPYEICAGGVGRAAKGSWNYNPTAHLQFEICESGKMIDGDTKEKAEILAKHKQKLIDAQGKMEIEPITDADVWVAAPNEKYFYEAIRAAIEYCAYLCKEFGLTADDVKSHLECGQARYGSEHVDPEHWLAYFGKTMTWFRAEVKKELESAEDESASELGLSNELDLYYDEIDSYMPEGYSIRGLKGNAKTYVDGMIASLIDTMTAFDNRLEEYDSNKLIDKLKTEFLGGEFDEIRISIILSIKDMVISLLDNDS